MELTVLKKWMREWAPSGHLVAIAIVASLVGCASSPSGGRKAIPDMAPGYKTAFTADTVDLGLEEQGQCYPLLVKRSSVPFDGKVYAPTPLVEVNQNCQPLQTPVAEPQPVRRKKGKKT